MTDMRVAAVGVHVLDTHVIGVESIPAGSDGQLVDTIRMSPAGTAGGTAVVLSRLGADVVSVGAVGTDPIADVLLDNGIHVDVKCADGICGVCKCGLVEGEVEHRDFVLSRAQRETEIVTCQSRAAPGCATITLDL